MKTLLVLLFIVFNFSAEATIYYVSDSGNDNNAGTNASSPWQTINKVNSFKKFAPGDKILFNRGDTFYGSITVSNSGSSGNPIIFGAYGSGEKPIITGFVNVTSWTNKGGNIWESNNAISSLSYCNIVSINNINTPMGRYPNIGYLTYQSHVNNTSITSSSLTGTPDWAGADVAIRINRWTVNKVAINSQSGATLNFNAMNGNSIDGFGFFIENDIRTLDTQNEWYYNQSTKKISVYSTSQPKDVQVASIDTLINLNTRGISYLVFDNLIIQGANNILIFNNSGNNISVTNCNLSYCGIDGIQMGGSYSNILNNTISDCGNSGVNLFYGNPGNHVVKNNTIKRTGVITGVIANDYSGGGIKCSSANSLIQYNDIDSSGYCGINFRGANVQVRNNFVNHSALVRDDGGGIYTGFSGEPGKIIDGNIILNVIGNNDGANNTYFYAQGIYIDDLGNNLTISNNTISNTASSGIKIHNSNTINIRNNTIYNAAVTNSSSKGSIELVYDDLYPETGKIRGILINNNILFAKTSTQLSMYFSSRGDIQEAMQYGTSDSNYYARPINNSNYINLITTTNTGPGVSYSLSGWQTFSGQDFHSFSTPRTIKSTDSLRFEYNAGTSSKTIALDAKYIDVKGNVYNGSITLAPYTSAVLIKYGPLGINQSPKANAGVDQTITLPSNSITLSGNGSNFDGTVTSYYIIYLYFDGIQSSMLLCFATNHSFNQSLI